MVEYASDAWDPHLVKNMSKLEDIFRDGLLGRGAVIQKFGAVILYVIWLAFAVM